jgi:glycosyltransferase involved in cell wall biosynthesis
MISVIIPTYNKAEYLGLTLASFVGQTDRDFELIIVDDGSNDTTTSVIKSYQNRLNIVHRKQSNKGRSAARNHALQAVSGGILVFNDDDRIVAPSFIEEHRKAFDRLGDQHVFLGEKERVLTVWKGVIMPLRHEDFEKLAGNFAAQWQTIIRSPFHLIVTEEQLIEQFDEAINSVYLGKEFDEHHPLGMDFSRFPDFRYGWLTGTTANMSVTKDAVLEAGGFDEKFKGWGMEDSDLCYRLSRAGLSMTREPKAINYHQVHPIGQMMKDRPISEERNRDLTNNIRYFHKKHQNLESYVYLKAYENQISLLAANRILCDLNVILDRSPWKMISRIYHTRRMMAQAKADYQRHLQLHQQSK